MTQKRTLAVTWTWARLPDLGVLALYEALALRSRVFVVEQNCAYQDPDGLDADSWHLLGFDEHNKLQACLRVVDGGLKYTEPSIGRVVTSPEARGTGLGQQLVAEGLARCQQAWPGRAVRISAQAHLQAFYGQFGFVAVSGEYLEDEIPHIEMLWSPPCPSSPPIPAATPHAQAH